MKSYHCWGRAGGRFTEHHCYRAGIDVAEILLDSTQCGGKSDQPARSSPAGRYSSLGIHRISQIFLIFPRLCTMILQGNCGPRRSWEVLGGHRKS